MEKRLAGGAADTAIHLQLQGGCENRPHVYATEPNTGSTLDEKASIRCSDNMGKRKTKKLTDQLRQAVDDSGVTRYQIAKETGIDESALAKFYNGHRGLSMEALNALGECLDLTITMRRKPGKKGK